MGYGCYYKDDGSSNWVKHTDVPTSKMIYFIIAAALVSLASYVLYNLYLFTSIPLKQTLIKFEKLKLVLYVIYLIGVAGAVLMTDVFEFQPYYEYWVLVIVCMAISYTLTDLVVILIGRSKHSPKNAEDAAYQAPTTI